MPRLIGAGHRAIALDLPGHGRDRTPLSEVTLQGYVDTVAAALDSLPDPAILVGHSRGGIVISQTAEQRPDKIKTLVYLAAYLIPDGQPMLPTALDDTDSLIVKNLEVNEREGWHMLKAEAFRDALYADCSDEDVALAGTLLAPEPNAPLATPLHLTARNYGRIPRVYIETLKDRGLSTALQRKMRAALPCQKVLSIDTSHSPFLSRPDELVELLTPL